MFASKIARAQAKTDDPPVPSRNVGATRVTQAGDGFEQEADRVADQVMAGSGRAGHDLVGASPLPIRRYEPGHAPGHSAAAPASVDQALADAGQPLQPTVRQHMEQRFGYDFSRVRVHSGSAAERSAHQLNARAYTVGQNIVLGAGTRAGQRTIAHELTHVVQQSAHVAVQREPKDPDPNFIIDPKAMDLVESALLRLYEALPRNERIDLKDNGTVAIAMVTERGKPNEPMLVYTTEKNAGTDVFHAAAESVGLLRWVGEAGVSTVEFQGPARSYPPTGPVPVGTGGLEHAEQFMIGFARDHGYIVHGMAVSRRFCADCPSVVRAYRGGRLMVSVITDPDETLPSGRRERSQAAAQRAAEAAEAEQAANEGGGTQSRGRARETNSGPRGRKPSTKSTLGGRGSTREAVRTVDALRAGKGSGGATQRRGGGGGSPAPVPALAGPRVTEGRGGAVAPITVPEPAMRMNSTRGAIEGAAVALVAMQLNALRSAELQAAVDKLNELTPSIQTYREQGYNVTVTLVVEVPDQVDLAAMWAGIGDTSQIVYFKKMYISQVTKPFSTPPAQASISENLAPGDPDQRDPHSYTLAQQVALQTGNKYPVPGSGPKRGFHFVSGDLALPSLTQPNQPSAQEGPPSNLHTIVGTYTPNFERLFIGNNFMIPRIMTRRLQVDLDANGNPRPKMWQLGGQAYAYQPYALHGNMVMNGRFAMGSGQPPDAEWIWSPMLYPREGLIFEWPKGLDSGLNITWDALVTWHKN